MNHSNLHDHMSGTPVGSPRCLPSRDISSTNRVSWVRSHPALRHDRSPFFFSRNRETPSQHSSWPDYKPVSVVDSREILKNGVWMATFQVTFPRFIRVGPDDGPITIEIVARYTDGVIRLWDGQVTGGEYGVEMTIAKSVQQANINAQGRFAKRVKDYFAGREDRTVLAVWGLSFKAKTDDVRESPAIYCIKKFLDWGMKVRAYDPEAASAAMAALDDKIETFQNGYDALDDAEAGEWEVANDGKKAICSGCRE